jgi:hypothetical protein
MSLTIVLKQSYSLTTTSIEESFAFSRGNETQLVRYEAIYQTNQKM